MHSKQLLDYITPHFSKTCLDHGYRNHPQQIFILLFLFFILTEHLPMFLVHRCAHKKIESGRKITLFISYHVMKPFQHMKLHLIRIILDFFLPLGKKEDTYHTIESPLRQVKCSLKVPAQANCHVFRSGYFLARL